jgi:hypothetical protein
LAIEITTRSKIKRIPPLVTIGVTICIILGIIVGGSYLYLTFSLRKINKEIKEKEASATSLTRAIFEKESQIIPVKNKITDFGILINRHKSPFGIFEIIEKNTLPTVWFSQLDFNSAEMQVSLLGNTDSFETLEQQISILKKEPTFQSINLSSVTVSTENGVNFSIQLIFYPMIFDPNI